MGRRSSLLRPYQEDGVSESLIGESYATIKRVADKLEIIESVADSVDEFEEDLSTLSALAASTSASAVAAAAAAQAAQDAAANFSEHTHEWEDITDPQNVVIDGGFF